MPKITPNKIVISRTDSIGDVVLTLPIAGILKKAFPDVKIVFLGNTYTKPIIECCTHVDEVWEWAIIEGWDYSKQVSWLKEQGVDTFLHIFPRKEIARIVKKAGVEHRIGTSHRAFNILTCNHKVNFTRKRSPLHEAQLNTKLLAPLGVSKDYSLQELSELVDFSNTKELSAEIAALLDPNKKLLILHPKSQGSAIEWGVSNFMDLANQVDGSAFQVVFTGTEKEAAFFRDQIPQKSNVLDLSGKLTLDELIALIKRSSALVAASTGPLHIAGVGQSHAIGLFSTKKPIHAGRWQPLGKRVTILNSKNNSDSTQPLLIEVRDVLRAINES